MQSNETPEFNPPSNKKGHHMVHNSVDFSSNQNMNLLNSIEKPSLLQEDQMLSDAAALNNSMDHKANL